MICWIQIIKRTYIVKQNESKLQYLQMSISLKTPGQPVKLPNYILQDLKNLHPRYKRNISFFGGHPVSITKQSMNSIFTDLTQNAEGFPESPYLVCQKTDGVRYLLLLCHVWPEDIVGQNQEMNGRSKFDPVQCYLISREGQKGLVAYATNLKIGKGWMRKKQSDFKHVIQILDGELIVDHQVGQTKQACKYLIFDILVHLQQNITKLPLLQRLKEINKFVECNNFLLSNVSREQQRRQIPLQIKDFFRLNSQKYNIVKFLLLKYIKCLPHQNDGLIFNHQNKEYEFGVNNGYVKWKPAHLNTVDFMLVPNSKLADKYGNRILDLYLATRDMQIEGNYVRSFYGFTIVPQEEFERIEEQFGANKDRIFNQKMENQEDTGDKGHFEGAVIAQCKFQQTTTEQKTIFRQIYDMNKDAIQIYDQVMRPFDEKTELSRIQSIQKAIYDRCWKLYKVRDDKGLPNNIGVAEKIEQSIKDNILEDELIKRTDEMNEKIYGRRS